MNAPQAALKENLAGRVSKSVSRDQAADGVLHWLDELLALEEPGWETPPAWVNEAAVSLMRVIEVIEQTSNTMEVAWCAVKATSDGLATAGEAEMWEARPGLAMVALAVPDEIHRRWAVKQAAERSEK